MPEDKKTDGQKELRNEIKELRAQIVATRAKIAAGKEKNLKAARNLRKELARKLSQLTK